MKCARCQQPNRPTAKFCDACGTPLQPASFDQPSRPSYAELHTALTVAEERQRATSDILRMISSSSTNVQPVFDAIAQSAMRLCDAAVGGVFTFDGELIHIAALANVTPEATDVLRRVWPLPPNESSASGRAILTRAVAHIPDVAQDPRYGHAWTAPTSGFRSVVAVPMLRDGRPIGVVTAGRPDPGPFTERQIDLLKTFADQAVIAIENVRLFKELDARNHDLAESLEQQTATSEILRVISSSPTDIQPVLDTVAENAAKVCGASDAVVWRVDGERLVSVASCGRIPVLLPDRQPLGRDSVTGRAVLEGRAVHVHDLQNDPDFPLGAELARGAGHRTTLAVPLVREGAPIGAILIRRMEVRPFTEKQIDLLKTFADQAVIAIENVRLFNELGARNRDLTTALEQQTATSEILRVISSSPTDIEPVFRAIVTSGRRLCDAQQCTLAGFDGETVSLLATDNFSPEGDEGIRRIFPYRAHRGGTGGRTALDRSVVHVPDVMDDPEYGFKDFAMAAGYRAHLGVPMFRGGDVIGVLITAKAEPGPFSENQIDLLKTFADQAVIAIENVRLFTELQQKNRALTEAHAQAREALEQQTATADILRVISRSQTDLQPVFDAIAESSLQLLRGWSVIIWRLDGEQLRVASVRGGLPGSEQAVRELFSAPLPIIEGTFVGDAIRDGEPRQVHDAEADDVHPVVRSAARARGWRSCLAVPMLHGGRPIGAITLSRAEPGTFAPSDVELLKTFADQAVIAVENARLLTELQSRTRQLSRSVEQLTALGEVGHAVSSTLDLEAVLTTIVSRAVQLSALDGGVVFEYDEAAGEFVHRAATETGGGLAEARRATRIRKGEGVVGQTAITLEPAQVPDITVPGAYESRLRENLIESGIRAVLAVPMARDDRLIGCLVVSRNRPGDFPAESIELLRTFATQSAIAIQNARLFLEIEEKSRQLEAASRHKSEFLSNMSHELRTPLNAIIGFAEVLAERMFGDLTEKQEEYLRDIMESGRHLLSLINDILDLSKIEAGRMELEPTPFDFPATLDTVLTLVRERAGRRGIALGMAVDERIGQIRADERKIRQVVLNLLSNAIKFTPEGGRIEVRAMLGDEAVEVSVSDTGIGIAPEDQGAVFEEFRQVGTVAAKVEGTGLGLALCRKFVELHGGKIGVTSVVGAGSTFSFTIPHVIARAA